MKTENKLPKDDIKNKQKLIYAILEYNSNLIQAWYVFAQSNFVTRMTSDATGKGISYTTGNSAFRNDKTFKRMTDWKNCKTVLKIFILRLVN